MRDKDTQNRSYWRTMEASALFVLLLWCGLHNALAQGVPASSTKPWHSNREGEFAQGLKDHPEAKFDLDANHAYTLAELVDLAEAHNPETRMAWQSAKAQAAALGIAKAALFPTIAAIALASTWRNGPLIGAEFHRQTIGLFQPSLNLNYLIFDFGGRSGAITEARDNLFAADFAFNDTHRRIIYQVTATYYRLLNAIGQLDAARATLANAQTVQQDAEARLKNGVATLPDVLEARSAAAQADYDLQADIGVQETVLGDLSTTLGLPANSLFQVQGVNELVIPETLTETAEEAVDHAFEQRPDLLELVAKARAADASLEQARSSYFPSLSFSGLGGMQRAYGQQDLLAGTYAGGETWNVQLSLQWTLFDGTRREHAIADAKAKRARAQAGIDDARDRISDEVWTAYSNARTSLRQKQAAVAFLTSAEQSYTAALRAYDLGLRNVLDVVAAQRTLAQARSADVAARTQVLTQISNLAFRAGDLLRAPTPKAGPQQ
jgi:outer membrane protein TolC